MKNMIINNSILYIQKHKKYDNIRINEIRYGLEAIYLTISKFIIISILAFILNIFNEMIIFMIFYNLIRSFAFGLHATKSWICLLSSTLIFIGIPLVSLNIIIPISIKVFLCVLGIIFMYKNSPADTYKRPIISKKRRDIYKFLSVIVVIAYSFITIYIDNNFISNCLIFSILLQNVLISPMVYRLFKLPYNNYINYLKKHPELVR